MEVVVKGGRRGGKLSEELRSGVRFWKIASFRLKWLSGRRTWQGRKGLSRHQRPGGWLRRSALEILVEANHWPLQILVTSEERQIHVGILCKLTPVMARNVVYCSPTPLHLEPRHNTKPMHNRYSPPSSISLTLTLTSPSSPSRPHPLPFQTRHALAPSQWEAHRLADPAPQAQRCHSVHPRNSVEAPRRPHSTLPHPPRPLRPRIALLSMWSCRSRDLVWLRMLR